MAAAKECLKQSCLLTSTKPKKLEQRIKRFNKGYNEKLAHQEHEYSRLRSKKRRRRTLFLERGSMRKIRHLQYSAITFVIGGSLVTLLSTTVSVGADTLFWKERHLFVIFGPIILGLGLVMILLVSALRDCRMKKIWRELASDKLNKDILVGSRYSRQYSMEDKQKADSSKDFDQKHPKKGLRVSFGKVTKIEAPQKSEDSGIDSLVTSMDNKAHSHVFSIESATSNYFDRIDMDHNVNSVHEILQRTESSCNNSEPEGRKTDTTVIIEDYSLKEHPLFVR